MHFSRAVVAASVIAIAGFEARADPISPTPPTALDKLLARTDAVAKEVAKVRGLPLRKPIPNEVVDRDELRKRLLAMANEDKTRAETQAEGIALARWGMIPFSTD